MLPASEEGATRSLEVELAARASQQAAVAELGQRALSGAAPEELMGKAAELVAANLDVEVVEVLRLSEDRSRFELRAGYGWPPELVGRASFPADERTLAGAAAAALGPVVVEDLREGAPRPDPLVAGRALGAGAAVPLRERSQPFGAIVAYAPPHGGFSPEDLAFLRSVAVVLGPAIGRYEWEQELRASRRRLELALEAGGMGAWSWDVATGEVRWSERLEEQHGLAPGTFGGTFEDFQRDIHPEDRERVVAAIRRALEGGEEYAIEYRIVRPDGEVRWLGARGEVVHDAMGAPIQMVGVCTDITERVRAEAERDELLARERKARDEAERASERLAFLAEASEALTASLDPGEILARLARLAVRRLADWCTVQVVHPDGSIVVVEMAHADPAQRGLAEEIRSRTAIDPKGSGGVAEAIRSRRPLLYPEITDELLREAVHDPEQRALLERLAPRSAMVVPLVARGRSLGAISFVTASSGRTYGPQDLAFAEELARRAALAIDNARLYQEHVDVARTLQRSLLPPQIPDVPGVEVATLYRPGREGVEVGGDFYDFFSVGDGSWFVAIGDVCGKGAVAAAATGLARNTIRAVAMYETSPARILEALNAAILGQGEGRFCTVALARFSPDGEPSRLVVACGGHPLPLVIRRDGAVEPVGRPGTLLGVFDDPELVDVPVGVHPGEAVVFYTDGATDDRGGLGERAFRRILAARWKAATSIGNAIAEALTARAVRLTDDVAVVVLRIAP
jgi:PAS domain S-box-containing protein